ncbi:MAG: hypothetical protein AAGJ83_03495 [Planctomycetota bacterium]
MIPSVDEQYTIVGQQLDDDNQHALLDIIFYSNESQAELTRWYLVKVDGQWKLYDWLPMQSGVRMSDLCAELCRVPASLSQNADRAWTKLLQVEQEIAQGRVDRAKAMLRSVDTLRVPSLLQPDILLSCSYHWMSLGEYEACWEAIHLINEPTRRRMWGFVPMELLIHLERGEIPEARRALASYEVQSPEHPNRFYMAWRLALLDPDAADGDAFEAALSYLRFCPEDVTVRDRLVIQTPVDSVARLIEWMEANEGSEMWSRVYSRATYDPEWRDAVAAVSVPASAPVGFQELMQAETLHDEGDTRETIAAYARSLELLQDEQLKNSVIDSIVGLLIESEDWNLLVESPRIAEAAMPVLAAYFVEDGVYVEPAPLLRTLQDSVISGDSPWAQGLIGLCLFEDGKFERASDSLITFADWLETGAMTESDEVVLTAAPPDDDGWMVEYVEYYAAQALIRSDQILDIFTRWPDEYDLHFTLWNERHSLSQSTIENFLDETIDDNRDGVRLQHQVMKAYRASRLADIASCEAAFAEAIEIARTTPFDSTYRILDLQRQRLTTAMRMNQTPLLDVNTGIPQGLVEEPQAESLLTQMLDLATDFERPDAFLQYFAYGERLTGQPELNSTTDLASIPMDQLRDFETAIAFAQAAMDQGDLAVALNAYQKAVAIENEERPWQQQLYLDSIIALALELQDIESAKSAYDSLAAYTAEQPNPVPIGSWDTWRRFGIGDIDAGVDLQPLLNLGNRNSYAHRWICSKLRRIGWSAPVASEDSRIFVPRPIASGVIYSSGASAPSESDILRWLSAVTPQQALLSEVVTLSDGRLVWNAQTDDGTAYRISFHQATIDEGSVPPELRAPLADRVQSLSIDVMDHLSRPKQRLFALLEQAAEHAGSDAMGAHWMDGSIGWFPKQAWTTKTPQSPGNVSLAASLKWRGGVPTMTATHFQLDLPNKPSSSEQYETTNMDVLTQELAEESESSRTFLLSIRSGGLIERLPVTLVSYDEDAALWLVELQADSRLASWHRSGQRVSVRQYELLEQVGSSGDGD